MSSHAQPGAAPGAATRWASFTVSSDVGSNAPDRGPELARFFLTAESNAFEILLPNGVELGGGADPLDPERRGDPPATATVPPDASESAAPIQKDPFGWDVILLLLAAPILIGSFRQTGKARWILLGVAILLMCGAAAVVLI